MRTPARLLTLLAVLAAIAAPIALAVHLSSMEAAAAARERALIYARRVIERTDSIALQAAQATAKLGVNRPDFPCEPAYLERMKQFALQSIYIQAIGYVVNDALVCSSFGSHGAGLPLGKAEIETAAGVRLRANVVLPMAPNMTFIAVENRSFAAIIHKDMPINITTVEDDVAMSVFAWQNREVLSSRGDVRPAWLKTPLGAGQFETVSERDGYTVAFVRSERYGTPGAVVAIPQRYLDERALNFAEWFVPVGALAGCLLALLVYQLAQRQNAMPVVLRRALRKNEFYMAYQPVVDLATGRWVGVEALIRWKRGSGEQVRPDVFIQAAEDAGLISQITERVLDLVRHDAPAMLHARRRQFHIGINLAAADLQSERTVGLLRALSRDIGASVGNLMVEATERGFMNADQCRRIVREIRSDETLVAIDDFGTGYSSLSYLQSFEVDFLKIDKSFVDTIGAEAATSHVIPHIIAMAKSLKLSMIAEGVETEAQAQYLREHGVQYAQGWLFGKPMPVAEILAKLAETA